MIFLELFVDDVLQSGSISGESGWQQRTISIAAGSHLIKWVYSKNPIVSLGSDCAWVDFVGFTRTRGTIAPALQLLLLD